jgi:hypothetical protein
MTLVMAYSAANPGGRGGWAQAADSCRAHRAAHSAARLEVAISAVGA